LRVDEHLIQLTALTHLALQYRSGSAAAGTASAWARLPQLQQLRINAFDPNDRQQVLAILAGVAAATSLTKLQLQPHECDRQHSTFRFSERAYAVCASLAGLTCLVDLRIAHSLYMDDDDAMALTALTALTRLCLHSSRYSTLLPPEAVAAR
jgi:hypothetical protein